MQNISSSFPRDMACMRSAHSFNRFRGFDQKLRHCFFIIIIKNQKNKKKNSKMKKKQYGHSY